MIKPEPEYFGISAHLLADLKAKKNECEKRETQIMWYVFLACMFLVSAFMWERYGVCAAVGSSVAGIFPILLLSFGIAHYIVKFEYPTLAKLEAYEKAIKGYDLWCIRQDRDWWFKLTGRRFEKEMALLFEKLGHQVELTPASGDGGVDLIVITKDDLIAVQCKAHRNPVGPAVVRELFGVVSADKKYTKGLLIALGGVTSGARRFASCNRIEIWTVTEVIRHARDCQYGADKLYKRRSKIRSIE